MQFNKILAACLVAAVAGCGVVYTAPGVSDGQPFGEAFSTDLNVTVVRMTSESTKSANLQEYVPPRLPLAFQPGEAAKIGRLGRQGPGPGVLPQPSAPDVARPTFIPERLPPPEEQRPYRIGVSDVLLLSVTADVTLDDVPALLTAQSRRQGYTVQGDGAIAIPDAGRVQLAGLTLQDAEAAIFDALVAARIDPSFTLEIAEFNSQSVSVGGAVREPTLVPLGLKPLRLHEAVQVAGGITAPDPSVTRVQLFRNGDVFQISMTRYLRDTMARNILLRDGDSVFVASDFREDVAARFFDEQIELSRARGQAQLAQLQAAQIAAQRENTAVQRLNAERDQFMDRLELGAVERHYAYRTGEVLEVGRVALPFERSASLADVLFQENTRGISIETSDYSEIYVLRASSDPSQAGAVTAYHLDAENAVNLTLATQFEIRPNDVVFVAEQPITSWNRTISQILPQLFVSAAAVAASN